MERETARYATVWVKQSVVGLHGPEFDVQACTAVDRVTNEWAGHGWTLHSIAPGSSGDAGLGVFLTFVATG